MQSPACTNLHVRTVRDAEVILHAARTGLLPTVTRRLSPNERAGLRCGDVYVWHETIDGSPDLDERSSKNMKRFTDGLSWDPSRSKDGFLFYLEKDSAAASQPPTGGVRVRTRGPLSGLRKATSEEKNLMIKKTYSVIINNNGIRQKWHLNSYYTENEVLRLRVLDDIPQLRDLQVPANVYRSGPREDTSIALSSSRARARTLSTTPSRPELLRAQSLSRSLTAPSGSVPSPLWPPASSTVSLPTPPNSGSSTGTKPSHIFSPARNWGSYRSSTPASSTSSRSTVMSTSMSAPSSSRANTPSVVTYDADEDSAMTDSPPLDRRSRDPMRIFPPAGHHHPSLHRDGRERPIPGLLGTARLGPRSSSTSAHGRSTPTWRAGPYPSSSESSSSSNLRHADSHPMGERYRRGSSSDPSRSLVPLHILEGGDQYHEHRAGTSHHHSRSSSFGRNVGTATALPSNSLTGTPASRPRDRVDEEALRRLTMSESSSGFW